MNNKKRKGLNILTPTQMPQRLPITNNCFLSIDSKKVMMKKIYCIKCNKDTLSLSFICHNCGSYDEKIFKVEESIEILKILGLI